MKARDVFYRSASSMTKCASGVNNCGNIIRKIDEIITTEVCPGYGSDEDLDHVMLCEKNKKKTEKNGQKKLKRN